MGRFHKSMSWNSSTESESDKQAPHSHQWDGDNVISNSSNAFFSLADTWSHNTSHRSFFLPVHYSESYQYPLVLWFHSNGFNEHQIDQVMPHISLRNYVGVGIRGTKAVDAVGHRFDWHASPASIATTQEAVNQAVEAAAERFSINASRVVLAGYREGGTMALRTAMREPDRFAGVISLGGRMPSGSIRNMEQLRQRRMPMLWQWGTENAQFNQQNLKTDFQLCMAIGSRVEVRQYPGDDEMTTIALHDFDEWIMRHVVADSSIQDSDLWASSPTLYSSN
ncbi:MAG: dienelactone hydrolase family protein [Rubripirellula sp.]|nr:phospholipase [Rhodopirellula sp.]MCH1440516.1 dienelactone hydrolase family protein [Rubripirellula sp.]